ncbi:CD1247 N-terminal domain-containing protein [Candidatus Contubernalis alkaliaceticus]|uniref:CD1247 N-terminal domain-containing protein n=1 Tax=Candidatus Contubernalis alkaliaceticus TaxID=338645 RepID=UPI001F4C35CA|nr:CD1247 N-terminal domain-containing protein [Candidatus Contubernalis alkalaceticus]UNC92558.1 AraC family transcriptional regulator [Candidatus Contubernalis alkalaceticus]
MEDLRGKLAYLKGLSEGLDLDSNSKEGKLFSQIIFLLEGITDVVDNLQADYDEMFEYVEAIDQDLTDLEDDVYEEPFDDEEEDDLEEFSLECPDCNEIVYIDGDTLDEADIEVLCPNCHRVVFVQGELWEEEDLDDEVEVQE